MTALITILIGIFVAFVGYQQWILNREKFKLDLFEKRFAVYKACQVFLTQIMVTGDVKFEVLQDFRSNTQDSVFLFDNDVVDYINKIDKKSLESATLFKKLEALPVGDKRSEVCEKVSDLIGYLIKELPNLKNVFQPYLKFKTWHRGK